MTKRELCDYCLTYPGSYEDYPFPDDIEWALIRHSGNKKTFACIYEKDNRLMVNLKCEPMEADFLRSVYKDVIPGYHMNKTHWNSVFPDGDVPEQELYAMITRSYELTKPKRVGKK